MAEAKTSGFQAIAGAAGDADRLRGVVRLSLFAFTRPPFLTTETGSKALRDWPRRQPLNGRSKRYGSKAQEWLVGIGL